MHVWSRLGRESGARRQARKWHPKVQVIVIADHAQKFFQVSACET
jgi:hypothetical protein